MKSLYLDPETRDFAFDGNIDVMMVDGGDEAAQHLRLLLTTRLREWFLNIRHGLDHGEILGAKMPDAESRIRSAIYDALDRDTRKIRVMALDFDYDPHTRVLTIHLTATVDREVTTVEVRL